MIDLRSDTVTQPTIEMREAMANAEVGDDVFGEDPTVKKLEEAAADLMGKEEALFVPTGTMGNQLAVLAHTERGDEVILDAEAHIICYEVGSPAMLAGVQLRPVPGLLGRNALDKLRQAYRQPDIHFPTSRLLCLENTFNRGGGTVMTPEEMKAINDLAKELNLAVHLDGARIFNAAIAARCDVKEFTRHCDSVMFSLSKGLCAPVGSVLAGTSEFIAKARKYRKALGGGMRQAGVLAAAGLVALNMVDRLAEDHANAMALAEGLAEIEGLQVELHQVQTNIVLVNITAVDMDAPTFVEEMQKRGVKAVTFGPRLVRFVTHKDVSRADIEQAVKVAKIAAGDV
ncbi:threonine aldolase [Desulfohalotomaculum tongense]|uniref:low-specificity L-threonine aldolase n=1 Tax=Desulforadius tongensis TaxID=1216062 RepID=UPI001EE5A39B|nr:low-specificity L-threonine aldolase [Desulforadius tongensis]MBM7855995.1 threonine aldolase [Desulforadius tongensis]